MKIVLPIVAAILLIVIAIMWLNGYLSDGISEDRAVSSEVVRNAQVEADRVVAAEVEQDRMVAERARAEQLEAINETMHEPGGDPAAAVYDRLRRSTPPAR